jgi:protein-S-isoprenylcysteine O-methyltransferase Ste14
MEIHMTSKPAMIFLSLFATILYLGIAVFGAGGIAAFFSHPARTALAVVTFALVTAALFTEGNLSTGEREDRGNRWVLAAFGVIGLLSAYLPAYTERIGLWTFGGDRVRWTGVALFAIGGALRIWPVFVLGKRFSGLVAIQPGHQLVTTGPYRVVRNPSYLGLLINAVGWALGFRSGVGLLLALLMVPPLIARIRAEERLLAANFGATYIDYLKRSWRLIPGVY